MVGCGKNEGTKSIENLPKEQNDERTLVLEAANPRNNFLEEDPKPKEIVIPKKNKPIGKTHRKNKLNSSAWHYKDMNFIGEAELSCNELGCKISLKSANARESISLESFQKEFPKEFPNEYSLEDFRHYFNNIFLAVDTPRELFQLQSYFFEPVDAAINRWENGILSGSFDVDLSDACYVPSHTCCFGYCDPRIIPDCVEELGQESFHVEFSITLRVSET